MECEVCDVNAAQEFYITSTSAPADDRPRVLKHGDLFAVFNRHGDIESFGLGDEWLFYEGTRFLSELVLLLGSPRPRPPPSPITTHNRPHTGGLPHAGSETRGHICRIKASRRPGGVWLGRRAP